MGSCIGCRITRGVSERCIARLLLTKIVTTSYKTSYIKDSQGFALIWNSDHPPHICRNQNNKSIVFIAQLKAFLQFGYQRPNGDCSRLQCGWQGLISRRVEMLGSVSENYSLTDQSVKMAPVNVGRTWCAPQWDCMNIAHVPNHLRVMVLTKVR